MQHMPINNLIKIINQSNIYIIEIIKTNYIIKEHIYKNLPTLS